MDPPDFLCPECGSSETSGGAFVECIFDPNDPWTAVLQQCECARCHNTIPAHLAERWDGISPEAAAEEWRAVYRSTAFKHRSR